MKTTLETSSFPAMAFKKKERKKDFKTPNKNTIGVVCYFVLAYQIQYICSHSKELAWIWKKTTVEFNIESDKGNTRNVILSCREINKKKKKRKEKRNL